MLRNRLRGAAARAHLSFIFEKGEREKRLDEKYRRVKLIRPRAGEREGLVSLYGGVFIHLHWE